MKPQYVSLALALASSITAFGQPPGRGGDRQGPPPSPLAAALDTDHDHSLSSAEIAAAATSLATLDANGDGALTRDELRPQPPEGAPAGERPDGGPRDKGGRPGGPGPRGMQPGPRGMQPGPPLVAALDTDKDGNISAAEIQAAPQSLKALDKDGNGILSPQEFAPQGGRRGGPGGPGAGGHRPGPPPAPEGSDDAAE